MQSLTPLSHASFYVLESADSIILTHYWPLLPRWIFFFAFFDPFRPPPVVELCKDPAKRPGAINEARVSMYLLLDSQQPAQIKFQGCILRLSFLFLLQSHIALLLFLVLSYIRLLSWWYAKVLFVVWLMRLIMRCVSYPVVAPGSFHSATSIALVFSGICLVS